MHWRYSAAFEGFVRERGFRIVVTARHPLDVLISILQYAPTDPTTTLRFFLNAKNLRDMPIKEAYKDTHYIGSYSFFGHGGHKKNLKLAFDIRQTIDNQLDAGFDLGETITAAMWRLCKQIKAELEGAPQPGRKLNGRITEPSTEKLQ